MEPENIFETQPEVCPICFRLIRLPCLACEAEAYRKRKRADRAAPQEEPEDPDYFRISLNDPEERRRYEELRAFRDKHHFPMWSEQWYEWATNQYEPIKSGRMASLF